MGRAVSEEFDTGLWPTPVIETFVEFSPVHHPE
jgi:hypothetical protein